MKPLIKTIVQNAKRSVFRVRRFSARRVVHSLHRSARSRRFANPLLVRLFLFIYFVKRTLQETVVRGWPLHRFRRERWRREVETAIAMKLLRWARDPLDRPKDAYPEHRRNNCVTDGDRFAMKEAVERWTHRPLISVLVPVFNAKPEWLDRLIHSILDQTYDRFELVLVDDASPNADVWPTLKRWADRDSRIVVERLATNVGVAAATNRAAELASGEFLAFADHDDELTPDALWRMIEALQRTENVDLVYSDEEIVPLSAPPYPMFKPGWSPELLVSFNYICHFAMIRRSAFDSVGGLRLGYDGAQDHDLLLRLSTVVREVAHVPRILYRWHVGVESMSRRIEPKTRHVVAADGIAEKTRRVVQEHLDRSNLAADAEMVDDWCLPRYRLGGDVRVSIIICTKDNHECLRAAVESIEKSNFGLPQETTSPLEGEVASERRVGGPEGLGSPFATTTPSHPPRGSTASNRPPPQGGRLLSVELLVIDTGAETPKAKALLEDIAQRCRVLRYDGNGERFNWSKVNNWAAEQATGDVLVFLNDDVEVLEPDWLVALAAVAKQSKIGAVGGLLEYPNGRIQHAGVILGVHGWGPWHVLMGARLKQPTDYQGVAHFQRNCIAVTGACLAIRKDLFFEVGGFDAEKLPVGFSDVDLCVRLHRRGYRSAYVPQARLIHREGRSRGMTIDPTEAAELASRTRGLVDPYWNPNFVRETHVPTVSSRRQAFGLRFGDDVRVLYVAGHESLADGPPTLIKKMQRLSGGDSDRARLVERLKREPFDVVVAVGWDAASAIFAAHDVGVPSIWHLPKRPMLESSFSPFVFQRFAKRWRALDLPYQTAFNDLHSRAWLQAGWMRPNARVMERVVEAPPMNTSPLVGEVGSTQSNRVGVMEAQRYPHPPLRGDLPHKGGGDSFPPSAPLRVAANDFIVAVDCPPGESETLECAVAALERLNSQTPSRISLRVVQNLEDLAQADVLIAQPFSHLRSDVLLTALAHGIPIIGSRFLEHADLMHVGVTGLRIPELKPKALAEALRELLTNEPRRLELGRQAKAWLASRASWEWTQTQWSDLLEEAAELNEASAQAEISAESVRSVSGELTRIPTTSAKDRS